MKKGSLKKVIGLPFLALIWIYQKAISPLFPGSCRFYPTCSTYSKQAIKQHGIFKGGILTFVRILRCNPFGGCGCDHVPEEFRLSEIFKFYKSK